MSNSCFSRHCFNFFPLLFPYIVAECKKRSLCVGYAHENRGWQCWFFYRSCLQHLYFWRWSKQLLQQPCRGCTLVQSPAHHFATCITPWGLIQASGEKPLSKYPLSTFDKTHLANQLPRYKEHLKLLYGILNIPHSKASTFSWSQTLLHINKGETYWILYLSSSLKVIFMHFP